MKIKDRIFSSFEHISFISLALDDLQDWEEDLDRERFTYPLQKCIDELQLDVTNIEKDDLKKRIFRHLASSPVYHEIMKEVVDLLEECQKEFSTISPKVALWCHVTRQKTILEWGRFVDFLHQISNGAK